MNRRFEALRAAFADVPEPIDPAEGMALYRWSREGSGAGDILLVGDLPAGLSFWLAAGCREAGLGQVVVDGNFPKALPEMIADKGLAEWVDFCHGAAGPDIVRLLILGGRSAYEECRDAMTRWLSRVENFGALIFHGVGEAPGPTQLHEEVLLSNPAVEEAHRIGSVRIFRARSSSSLGKL